MITYENLGYNSMRGDSDFYSSVIIRRWYFPESNGIYN